MCECRCNCRSGRPSFDPNIFDGDDEEVDIPPISLVYDDPVNYLMWVW